MKRIGVLLLLLTLGTYAGGQTLDTVFIVVKAKKFRPSKYTMIMYERLDTLDASGRKTYVSRSYYFDNEQRILNSVRENDNITNPKKGTEVIYSFAQNKLSAVTIIPPRSKCKNCASRYFYANDTLVSKQENRHSEANSANFVQQAHYFQSKVPKNLPWGYFDDEVLIDGKRKKVKRL